MIKKDSQRISRKRCESNTSFKLVNGYDSVVAHEVLEMLTDGDSSSSTYNLMQDLLTPLSLSDSLINLLKAIDQDWTIQLDQINDGGYTLDLDNKIVLIDHAGLMPDALSQSVYFKQCIRHNFLRAIREIWHAEKFQDDYDSFVPESLIKCERVRSADVECFAILSAYELSLKDDACRLWQHIMGSDIGDMAIQFNRYLERGTFTHNMLDIALQQAFKQWYQDEARVNACDHRSLEELDRLIEWNKDAIAARHAHLETEKLSEMTMRNDGQGSYLGDLNIRLMRHPDFAMMNDIINQSHLSHIVRDLETISKGDVYFRSAALADKIFPEEYQKISAPMHI